MDKPQTRLLLWSACLLLLQTCWSYSFTSNTTHLNKFTDQAALLAFKSHITSYPNDTLFNSWNTNTTFCNWVGVFCSRHRQRVSKLDLRDMGLEGAIPPHIGNLSFLVYLNLSSNIFNGHLPHELGCLRRLKVIDLSANKLEGNIPMDLGRLFNLQYLDFRRNRLSGEIPAAIFNISSLVRLSFSHNNFSGQLPTDAGSFLPNLERLDIEATRMYGPIPISLSNASKLTVLWLDYSNLTGSIPDTLGRLLHLEILSLAHNNLIGTIPSNIFNFSNLTIFAVQSNQLSGHLPPDIGNRLPNMGLLNLWGNQLSGQIPLSLGNASKLFLLELSVNDFTGTVPITIGKLSFLKRLYLHDNQLTNEPKTNKLDFLTYLTRCNLLQKLTLSLNPLHGILPISIGNFSILEQFFVDGCQLEGEIPRELGNLSSLILLSLYDNSLHGTIPSTIERLEKLQICFLQNNRLEGSIPIELINLRNLDELYLGSNKLSGVIPNIFHNLSRLQKLSLENNNLMRIPSSLWTLENLLELYLSQNSFGGILPQEVGNLKQIVVLDLSANQFKSNIPNSLGYFQMLQNLNLSSNSLEGPIPQSFDQLISLVSMDLSSNHLNGTIPKSIETLRYLEFLNLSFNNLEGEIPGNGVFGNLTAWSFIGNSKLCSLSKLHIKLNVSICLIHKNKSRINSLVIKIIISTLVVTTSAICFSLLIIYHRKKKKNSSLIDSSPTRAHERISYQDLLHATNNFSEANLIGVGSFGSVYKGTMVDGSFVAVKVLNIESLEAWDSFTAECEVMRNVRHRNLVKIITSCSNLDFRALVLQFMSNGTLDQWLYSHNKYLRLLQRIGIMIDVASAMEYLHNHYSIPVVHCDLKPSNILLDEDMIAHVSDFGIAKLLDKDKSTTRTNTLGTIGYVAPEYGLVGKVSTKVDVYSYGILLLEMLTRKKPTDSIFIEGLSLRKWVDAAFPNAIIDVVDMNLLNEISNSGTNIEEINELHGSRLSSILSIVEVGLLCSRELADERICMKEARIKLMKIKECLLI